MWKILKYNISFKTKEPYEMANNFFPRYTMFQIIKGKIMKCLVNAKKKELSGTENLSILEIVKKNPNFFVKRGDESIKKSLLEEMGVMEKLINKTLTLPSTVDNITERLMLKHEYDIKFKTLQLV